MHRISHFLTQYCVATYLILAALCVPPTLGMLGIRFPGVKKGDRPQWVNQDDIRELLESQEAFGFYGFPCIVVLEADDFFRADRMNAIRKSVQEIHAIPDVHNVAWLGQIPRVTWLGAQDLLPPEDAPEARFQEYGELLRSHPLVRRHLLSDDEKTTLIYVIAWSKTSQT